MNRFIILAVLVLALVLSGLYFIPQSADQDIDPNKVYIATTIHPLGLLLKEMVPAEREVFSLVPAGQSPHTYSPKPSDARRCEQAILLVCVAPTLDAWATRVPVSERVHVLSMLPKAAHLNMQAHHCAECGHDHGHHDHGHDHGHHDHGHGHDHALEALAQVDPHFWLDPQSVAEVVEPLAKSLAKIDPDYAEHYQARAAALKKQFLSDAQSLREKAALLKGRGLIQFHPSMAYFLKRIEMVDAGVVNAQVSSSPTPKALEALIQSSSKFDVLAVCTEPQLPKQAAERIAEHLHLPLVSIDPLGADAKNLSEMWNNIVDQLLAVQKAASAP